MYDILINALCQHQEIKVYEYDSIWLESSIYDYEPICGFRKWLNSTNVYVE